ncbi:MAG: hypothetical protein RRB13_02615 [bacterium]|nr:hypothetical protein [bacterium]
MEKFVNLWSQALAAAVAPTDSSITISDASALVFASPTDYYRAVVFQSGTSHHEILKITAKSGNLLTVTRALEGTSALAFNPGDSIEIRLSAGSLDNFAQLDAPEVVFQGNLLVQGQSLQISSQIQTADTQVLLNDGEVGPGVTNQRAGLLFARGSASSYGLHFDENNDTARLGEFCGVVAVTGLSGSFAVGEPLSGATSGALGRYIGLSGSNLWYIPFGSVAFTSGETVTGANSSATATTTGASTLADDTQALTTRADEGPFLLDGSLAQWDGVNKRLVAVVGIKDEDNMASDSDADLPTQQSVKAYADAKEDRIVMASGTNSGITANVGDYFGGTPAGVSLMGGATITGPAGNFAYDGNWIWPVHPGWYEINLKVQLDFGSVTVADAPLKAFLVNGSSGVVAESFSRSTAPLYGATLALTYLRYFDGTSATKVGVSIFGHRYGAGSNTTISTNWQMVIKRG